MTEQPAVRNTPENSQSGPAGAPVSPGPLLRSASYGGYPYGARDSIYGATPDEEGFFGRFNFARLMRVLLRKWVTIAVAASLGLLAGVLYLLGTPRMYVASSLIEMSLRRPRIMTKLDDVNNDGIYLSSEEILNTRLGKLRSPEVIRIAVARFKETKPGPTLSGEAIRDALGAVSINLLSHTMLVEIRAENTDPAVAAAASTAFAEAVEASSVEENRHASDSAVAWLQSQAVAQRDAVERADQKVVNFRSENKIDVLEIQKKTFEEAIASLGKSLVDIGAQAVLMRDVAKTLEGMENDPENAGKLPGSMPRAEECRTALNKWTAARTERDTLLTRYTLKHPEVVAMEQTIAVLKKQVTQALGRSRETAEAELALLQKQETTLRDKIEEQSRQVMDFDRQIVERSSRLTSLQRERDAADVIYRGVLSRIEEARMAADENTATVKVLERALPPRYPFKPVWHTVLVLALAVGLIVGLGLALAQDRLEDRVAGTNDIERVLGLKIVGMVPHVEAARREYLALAGMNDKFSRIAEAFAGIRNVLDSAQYKDVSHRILVASTQPEEGKTIVAANLAVACAHGGSRTLLVDLDLRRPRLGTIFGMPVDAYGLMDVLSRECASDFERLPFRTACASLDMVASRPSRDISPAAILGRQFVRSFIEWAAGRYDRVIIDSPPLGGVSDSVILAGLAGCVLIVCRPDHTRKRLTLRTVQHLTEIGVVVAGAVLNDVGARKRFDFSDDEYYHRYPLYENTDAPPVDSDSATP